MLIKKKKIPLKAIILIGFLPSFLKKIIYKIRGYKIGKNVSFGIGSVIIGKNVTIGDNSSFGLISVVRGNVINIGRFVSIGSLSMIDTETIIIGDDSRINENVIVGGIKFPESMLKIGKRVIIMEYSFINPTKPIIIGDDTGIGGHCLLFTHGSWLNQLDGFPVTFAPITLGERVWLPWRAFIMPGVKIGDEVVIQANSMITTSIPSNVIAAGSPAVVRVKNYPRALSEKRRNKIIYSIIDDFKNYLEHYSYIVKHIQEDNGLLIKIEAKNRSEIFLCKNTTRYSFSSNDHLLIIDSDVRIKDTHHKMTINLKTKKRIGTSKVGEEFIKFVSRYGIRLDRLD
jgi:acetyltransferase-like isoleucine patch superfamily enzyme